MRAIIDYLTIKSCIRMLALIIGWILVVIGGSKNKEKIAGAGLLLAFISIFVGGLL